MAELRTNVTICLNGKTVTAPKAARVYFIKPGATLSVVDCTAKTENGVYTAGKFTGGTVAWGTLFSVDYRAVINWYDGIITGNKSTASSGGIYLFKTPAKLTGGNIYNNDAASSVGGMLLGGNTENPVIVENVKFYNNQANGAGAVIVQGKAVMQMKNCQITDNLARTGHGGGLYVSHNSLAIVTDSVISGNEANNGGGYYAPVNTNATLNNCVLEDNVARAVGGAGYTRGNLTLNDCIVRGNTAEKNGGGIATWKVGTQNIGVQPGLLVNNSLIENNTAGAKGGGLYLELGCNAQLTNTTIQNNTAALEGGALYAIDDLLIHGMTVTGNQSGGEGFAVYLDDNRYDGHSYHTGLMKMCGDVIVKDNQGGDLYLGPTTVISACAEDFGKNTYIHVVLDSGVVTNRIFGTYNYEGGNQDYILTYGTRSIDEPETDPNQPQAEQTETQEKTAPKNDTLLFVLVGVFVLVIAALVPVIVKKKKPAGADKK